ncbi:hypothetical protein HMPREF0742_02390 [Rothia aeria F0184]|uniref:Uncharacterized protein n=1 Tax=Rothia aeria F0184 TaxID=888019 RepID=U7UXI5_9MICC|nr:hypothetical protein [Rothia aeria]ERT64016.1 hypothetical protein HMPREF0742_02390 [Rothia aeria F0184]
MGEAIVNDDGSWSKNYKTAQLIVKKDGSWEEKDDLRELTVNADGSYTYAATNGYRTYEVKADGSWTLKYQDGTVYSVSADGKMTKEGGNGKSLASPFEQATKQQGVGARQASEPKAVKAAAPVEPVTAKNKE